MIKTAGDPRRFRCRFCRATLKAVISETPIVPPARDFSAVTPSVRLLLFSPACVQRGLMLIVF